MAFICTISTIPPHSSTSQSPRCSHSCPRISRRTFVTTLATTLVSVPPAFLLAQPSVSVEDVIVGNGKGFSKGDLIKLHYVLSVGGFVEGGGRVVDTSKKRGRPFSYKFDTGMVIKGWDIGVKGMKVGGRRKLVIPSELGYGERGAGGVIPPNSTLYFDIELLGAGY